MTFLNFKWTYVNQSVTEPGFDQYVTVRIRNCDVIVDTIFGMAMNILQQHSHARKYAPHQKIFRRPLKCDETYFCQLIESLSTGVFEPRTAAGNGTFSSLALIARFLFINSN